MPPLTLSSHTVPLSKTKAFAVQDKVSQAWVNFARTSNPRQKGLEWKPYTHQDPQNMVFDVISECNALRDEKLVLCPQRSPATRPANRSTLLPRDGISPGKRRACRVARQHEGRTNHHAFRQHFLSLGPRKLICSNCGFNFHLRLSDAIPELSELHQ